MRSFRPSLVFFVPLLAGLLLALGACAPATEIRSSRPLGEVQAPEFALVPGQTMIERFDPPGTGAGLSFSVGTIVRNPNPFSVRVDGIRYSVALERQTVAQGELEPDLLIAPGGTAPLRFQIETDLGRRVELIRSVVGAFADTPLVVSVQGDITFSSESFQFTSRRRTLVEGDLMAREAVRAPLLRLVEADSEVLSLQGVPVVRVVVLATNPGDIGYFLFGKDLTLRLGGQPVATDDLRPVPVPAGEQGRVDLLFYPAVASLDEAARAALDAALQGIPTSLELDGRLFMDVLGVDTFAVPDSWEVFGFVDADL